MAEFPDHPFWDFSLQIYMTKGVAQACLELQDTHDIDVNVLLFCLWAGASRQGTLTTSQMKIITDSVDIWHKDIVRGLRAVRTGMKDSRFYEDDALTESVRQRIQKTEIDCEHIEQLILAGALDLKTDRKRSDKLRLQDALSNMGIYLRTFTDISEKDRENVVYIAGAAFPSFVGDIYPISLEIF
ncbi:MAG: TIGR02444 family protein [Pseudomonadota bacterium]|nr:TIGR02444 family protein [Pseudomonadota bacterium]